MAGAGRYPPEFPLEGATCNLSFLREQQHVSCDTIDSGCNGEPMNNSFAFDKKSTRRQTSL